MKCTHAWTRDRAAEPWRCDYCGVLLAEYVRELLRRRLERLGV